MLASFPFIMNIFLSVKIVYLRIPVENFIHWHEIYLVRIRIFAYVESSESPYIQINARFFRVVVELMRAGLARFEEYQITAVDRLQSGGRPQGGGTGGYHKQFFRIPVKMIGTAILIGIQLSQVKNQLPGLYPFFLAGNIGKQPEPVYPVRVFPEYPFV
jgi:hypothetical protein